MDKPPPKGCAFPLSQTNDQPRDGHQLTKVANGDTSAQHIQYGQSGELENHGIERRLYRTSNNREADVENLSSSSSRKRTRKDYLEGLTDGDLEGLLDVPFHHQHKTRKSMLPPPLPMQRPPQRATVVRRGQLESTPTQRYLESSSNIVYPRLNVSELQLYQDGAWNDARQEDGELSQSLRPYQRPEPTMSGAIGPAPGRQSLEGTHVDHRNARPVPQPRFTRPAPDSRMGNDGQVRQSGPPSHSELLQYQQNANELNRHLQTPAARLLPSRAASRSSFVRQSLISAPSRGNNRGTDSGYFSNGEPQRRSRYGITDENFAPAPPCQGDRTSQPSLKSPFFMPKFSGPIAQQESPMYHRGASRQPQQLERGFRHLGMESLSQTPRVRPSLNALSFIDEPYTSTNQPIFTQQRDAFSQSHEEQPYRPAVISRAGFIQDPRVQQQPRRNTNSIRLPSGIPSSSQPLAHTTKGARSGGSMVRPIGRKTVQPSANSYSPGGGYFPRNNAGAVSSRGIFSAAGRRSVRR